MMVNGKGASSSHSQPRMDTTLTQERAKSNAIFSSTIDRFNQCYSAKAPGIRILNSKAGKRSVVVTQSEQGKHVYDKAAFGIEN